jgi:hypothetical protein
VPVPLSSFPAAEESDPRGLGSPVAERSPDGQPTADTFHLPPAAAGVSWQAGFSLHQCRWMVDSSLIRVVRGPHHTSEGPLVYSLMSDSTRAPFATRGVSTRAARRKVKRSACAPVLMTILIGAGLAPARRLAHAIVDWSVYGGIDGPVAAFAEPQRTTLNGNEALGIGRDTCPRPAIRASFAGRNAFSPGRERKLYHFQPRIPRARGSIGPEY